MKLADGMRKYRLQSPTTPENLEMRFSGMDGKTLVYGDRVLLAGHYWMGIGMPSWFGAVYEYLTDAHSCEGEVELRAVSEVRFQDEGHAVEWALAQK